MSVSLSICIATRNRPHYLKQALTSLSGQISSQVEIVIVDGSSNDLTEQMLTRLSIDSPVNYIHLAQNGGIDRDFDLAVERASGLYCWLCADDDLFIPDAVSRVLEALAEAPTVLVVDAQVLNTSMNCVLIPSRLAHVDSTIINGNDRSVLLTTCGDHLTFIGATVVSRTFWLSRSRVPYYGSFFIHVGVLFQDDFPGFAKVMPGPVISIRSGNESWSKRTFEIWNILWPQIVWQIKGVDAAAKSSVVAQRPWASILRLAQFRALGAYSLEEYKVFIKPHVKSMAFRICACLVALTPGRVLNILGILYALVFMRNKPKALQDVLNSRFSLFKTKK